MVDDANAAAQRETLGFTGPILNKATPGTFGTTTPSTIYSNYLKLSGEASFVLQSHTGDGATTINWRVGNKHNFTFGASNETLTFTTPYNSCNLILKIVQDNTGGRTISWPASVKWPGGTPPTLSTGGNKIDIVSFFYDGTYYYGIGSLDFS